VLAGFLQLSNECCKFVNEAHCGELISGRIMAHSALIYKYAPNFRYVFAM